MLCVGIGHGRILKIGDEDVYGHEVNLASKLGEDAAKGDEILATTAVKQLAPESVWEEVAANYAGETVCWRVRY